MLGPALPGASFAWQSAGPDAGSTKSGTLVALVALGRVWELDISPFFTGKPSVNHLDMCHFPSTTGDFPLWIGKMDENGPFLEGKWSHFPSCEGHFPCRLRFLGAPSWSDPWIPSRQRRCWNLGKTWSTEATTRLQNSLNSNIFDILCHIYIYII